MFLEMGFLFRYWKVGKKKQMDTTRMSERWKANLPDRRDTLYSYLVPREITQLQALPLAVARVPNIASYPSRPRQAQAPDAARKCSKSQSGVTTLGLRRFTAWKKQTARDGRVSETYRRDRQARVNGSRAGKMARTRSKIPWFPKR
jgi:hypothetical protein